MDRYDSLDLECEAEGGNHKASLFKGMFKRSTKSSAENTQDDLSLDSERSISSDSLSDNNNTDKSSGIKGVFKKNKPSKDATQNADVSDTSTENTRPKDKALGAAPRPPPKPGHLRRASQDTLDFDDVSSSDNVTENTATKESSGIFGMFKKSPKPTDARRPSQDNLSTSSELWSSQDSLTLHNSKEGGVFSGIFRKSPKIFTRTQSQDDLSDAVESTDDNNKEKAGIFSGVFKKQKGAKTYSQEDVSDVSGSRDELSDNNKEKSGLLSGVFKKPRLGARSQSKDDLAADGELSNSQENLTEGNTKEKTGILSGVFKKQKFGARSQSKEDLTADDEISTSGENLSQNNKEKSGLFGVMFKKQKTQSQDDLCENGEVSSSTDSLTEKSSKGGVSNFLKNTFTSSAQKEEKVEKMDKNESVSSTDKPKIKQNGFSALMKTTFQSDKPEKLCDPEAQEENEEKTQSTKPSKFAGAMTKLNPFRSAQKVDKSVDSSDEEQKDDESKGNKQKETCDQETTQNIEKREEEPHGTVKYKASQLEARDRSETILELKTRSRDEEQQNPEETVAKHGRLYPSLNKSDDETVKEEERAEEVENKPVKVKRPKHHNPFMPRTGAKLVAVETAEEAKEEEEEVEASTREENKEEEKAKKPKKRNPFMPQVKNKVGQKRGQSGAEGGENEGGNRTLFDQLEEFRFEPSQPENSQDMDNLMEWWDTVENWEDTPQTDDMTPKEEAKAFAVTAEKIQKGIRVFNKLFSERAESLWQHVIDLNGIADALDKFNKKTKIAQITGGSTSATGGVLTIAGLALAPITMGTSLIVTAVGLGVATAGGLTSAGAGISNQVNNSMDRKKVEKIVEDYQEKMVDPNKALKFIKQGIEQLRKFDLIKIKKHAYNRDFPVLNSKFYEDGAMAGKAILINANEIMRVVQIANVAGSTAARAVQIASMATGVLTGLFVGMDIYFVAKDSKELKKGAKSEFAAKIREVAQQLHDGLVELNTIRDELQATTSPGFSDKEGGVEAEEEEGKKNDKYDDEEEEDEIDRIKKQIKKDYENREWV